MKPKAKALVVLSGGQDSTTCLYWALERSFDVWCVTFNYGQRHVVELGAARKVADMAGITAERHEFLYVGKILNGTSPLVADTDLEQYKDHQSLPGGLEKTFVPMRNQLFITLAANRAYCLGINTLVLGVCEEDYGGYPDCRRSFIEAMEKAGTLGTFTGEGGGPNGLNILTPLMNLKKRETVDMALDMPGCYSALAWSHTAYDGQYPPLGHDHATLLRAKGFEEAGVPDPLVLRAHSEGLMELPKAVNYRADLVKEYMARI
jgi:7-cyano-7-deazaguanine synthase